VLTREDVERITENVLRNLALEMEREDWTNPNQRTIVLKHNGQVISRTSFDVVQAREYEG
jgi:hypothetical protein